MPPSMHSWIEERFGSVESVSTQRVVKVTNLVTMEGALFNPLRGARPLDFGVEQDALAAIERTRGGPFCNPETLTPEDVLGIHDKIVDMSAATEPKNLGEASMPLMAKFMGK